MSPEERELLKRSVALAEENNNILHSMRRSMRLARIMSMFYWIFIIGTAVGAYYLIQPYLEQLMGVYGGATGGLNGGIDNIKNLLNGL
ncbi:MAG: hypothetical protein NTX96_00090 [Candidatus Zambryskibacteria bacterium]|nr:hypothetical protein [Candidatus Zambryskibacteria bacterium]